MIKITELPQMKAVDVDETNEWLIDLKACGMDTNRISDGYHTFGELYEHRIVLYMALCKAMACQARGPVVWRSKCHSDGTGIDGWFLLGIGTASGEQITYHLPIERWEDCRFAGVYALAPKFDGHTSADVLKRLNEL